MRPSPLPLHCNKKNDGQRHQRRLKHRRGGDGGEEQDQLVSRVICDRVGLFPLNANNYVLPGKNVGMNKQE